MTLSGSLIPSDKYFVKNFPFVVRISTRVATSPFQSNSLRGQGEEQTTKKQCPSWPTGREVMTTSSCWVRGYNSTPLPTVQHSSKSYRRARQRCFWLLAFISRPQVRNIHLPGRMILPGSLIPSHKYFLKNLTFVVLCGTTFVVLNLSWPTGLPVR